MSSKEAPSAAQEFTRSEVELANRNHGMPLEALSYDVSPIGMHFTLVHFDVPNIDRDAWRLDIVGAVSQDMQLTYSDLATLPQHELVVTMECAGNGRMNSTPRALSQPWDVGGVGTGRWSGVRLRDLMALAGVRSGAKEVIFSGADSGIDGETRHRYERSLAIGDALGEDVLLATHLNGEVLPPQHGFPARLVVPGWYGMANVKWLSQIRVAEQGGFAGYQQTVAYMVRKALDDPGFPATRMLPRSLLLPPGLPDVLTRERYIESGLMALEGRAWSGNGRIVLVELSLDGGSSWSQATLGTQPTDHKWVRWTYSWEAEEGEYDVVCRATDASGEVQPLSPIWNIGGYLNNVVQHTKVHVVEQMREMLGTNRSSSRRGGD